MPLLPSLSGYQVTELIHQGLQTILYRAVAADGTACVLKMLRAEFPTNEQIARLKHEYHIIADLDLPGVIQPIALELQQNRVVLVIEDIGGRSLKQYIQSNIQDSTQNNTIDLDLALSIALQIARTLVSLHQHQIIHKDIKPANIIFNSQTQTAKLTDFTLATRIATEITTLLHPNQLEGTLAYLPPEQTGRMNRSIDYRTDFYAFGVTLYELFSGQLPFTSPDPLVLIHSHIAKTPPPIQSLRRDLPDAIAKIIAKLMAKNAEDRYQSAAGLVADLEQCLVRYRTQGTVPNFEIGQLDRIAQLNIPEKLYGREQAVATLQNAFEQACNGSLEVVVISGYSGVGKTKLVKELFKSLSAHCGYFISGKCDQFQQNIPMGAISESYRGLMRQILSESPESIARWRSRFQSALGENAQIVIDCIPELELIIGPGPELIPLDAAESHERFISTFRRLWESISRADHPIIDFMDDVQWVDIDSLGGLPNFVHNPKVGYYLLIMAYRDNEVDATHPLSQTLKTLQATGKHIHRIHLNPLSELDINHLVSDTLSDRLANTAPIAHLIHHKTQGNPFFVIQLLKLLQQKEILTFNYTLGRWQWNIQQIHQEAITDNVVELMIEQLYKLSIEAQWLIQTAACIGHQFDLKILSNLIRESPSSTCQLLLEVIQAGLIVPLEQIYKVVVTQDAAGELDEILNPQFRFLHDRVQQAAYETIVADRLSSLHWQVGQVLLIRYEAADHPHSLFNLVHHLNRGVPSNISDLQRIQLIHLNQQAAQKARSIMSLSNAFGYIQQAIALVHQVDWANRYEESLALYSTAVEIAYVYGQLEIMETWHSEVIGQAREALDRTAVQMVRIQALITTGQLEKALQCCRESLADLGFTLPDVVTDDDVAQVLQSTTALVAQTPLDRWIKLSPATDKVQLAIARLLTQVLALAYINTPTLLPLISLFQVQILLKFGRFPDDAIACANYAFLVNLLLKDPEQAYALAQISQHFMQGNPSQELRTRANITLGGLVIHHTQHLKETCSILMEGYHSALAAGNVEFVTYHAAQFTVHQYLLGKPLVELRQIAQDFQAKIFSLDAVSAVNHSYLHQTAIDIWLRQLPENSHIDTIKSVSLSLIEFGEEVSEISHGFAFSTLCFHQLIFYYIFGEYGKAIEIIDRSASFMPNLAGTFLETVVVFYSALTLLAANINEQTSHQQIILNHIERLEFAARYAPMNYQHKLALVRAEQSRVLGQIPEAMQYYQEAITLAETYGYIQEKAIACERTSEFYRTINQPNIAQMYLREAYAAYGVWGATLKIEAMAVLHPDLQQLLTEQGLSRDITSNSSSQNIDLTIDLTTVIQASQVLAGEVVLDRLVEKLMQLVRDNAGAQKVVFISMAENQVVIEACLQENGIYERSLDVTQGEILPQFLVNYVIRTKESLVIDDATIDTQFGHDPYIQAYQPLSIVVVPLLQKNEIIGALYLENNLTAGAFTRDRCEILSVIASQAAISLENAKFYATMENRIEQRTQELSSALEQLQETQIRLVQSEKMSSLGQLVAGIAHEINNPINFIYGNLTHAEVYAQDLLRFAKCYQSGEQNDIDVRTMAQSIDLDYMIEDFPKVLRSMQYGADRVQDIVQGLRDFARLDESEYKAIDIHQGLDSTLMLLTDRLGEIRVTTEYGLLPQIECYAAELNQVFLNLLTNAIDALSGTPDPMIRITTSPVTDQVVRILVKDNGTGISQALISKIFDPFFTTKPVGQGTGLGLAIAHQVVTKQHRGQLNVASTAGIGTTFEILLPIQSRLNVKICEENPRSLIRTS